MFGLAHFLRSGGRIVPPTSAQLADQTESADVEVHPVEQGNKFKAGDTIVFRFFGFVPETRVHALPPLKDRVYLDTAVIMKNGEPVLPQEMELGFYAKDFQDTETLNTIKENLSDPGVYWETVLTEGIERACSGPAGTFKPVISVPFIDLNQWKLLGARVPADQQGQQPKRKAEWLPQQHPLTIIADAIKRGPG